MSKYQGIEHFLEVKGTVTVFFPNGEARCVYCPYLSSNDRMCQLNKKPIFNSKYIGEWCPLDFETAEAKETVEE